MTAEAGPDTGGACCGRGAGDAGCAERAQPGASRRSRGRWRPPSASRARAVH